MPLIKGKSQKSFVKNLKTEMEEGKPQKQSLAIAYSMKRKAQHKKAMGGYAEGDEVEDTSQDSDDQKSQSNSLLDPNKGAQISASFKKMGKKYADGGPVLNPAGVSSLADAFGQKKAKGGFITDNYQPKGKGQTHPDLADHEMDKGYMSHPGNDVKPNSPAHSEDDEEFNQEPVDMNAETDVAEEGLVDRIMHKMSQNFSTLARLSQGGMVANDTGNGQSADAMPNQFDDMVLDDDLESSYGDDDNAGDALGNEQEDEDRKDIVARIMASRKKKDKLPHPA